MWHRLFGTDVHEHEANIYGQTVEDGGVVISVRVPESEVAHASAVLNIHRPVDVHDRAVTSGIAPAAHVEAVEKKLAALPLAAEQQVAVSPKLAAAQPDVLRLAEEHLEVGKEMAETGRTRVRRFVTEREVAQDVTLHEEHAEVLRKAVSDPTFVGEIDWADGTIEIIETAEHALVNKTARVVEEVGLKKIGVRPRRDDPGQTPPPAGRNRATWRGRQGHSRPSDGLIVSPSGSTQTWLAEERRQRCGEVSSTAFECQSVAADLPSNHEADD